MTATATRHCEAHSDEAIQLGSSWIATVGFAYLAMTAPSRQSVFIRVHPWLKSSR